MFDFLRIACAVPQVSDGNVTFNLKDMIRKMHEAEEQNVDVLLFPELCLSGYACGDLFFQSSLLQEVRSSINLLAEASGELKQMIVFGAPMQIDGKLYNCAVVCLDGAVRSIIPKVYIPNAGAAQEKRWFSSGILMKSGEVTPSEVGLAGSERIQIGANQILKVPDLGSFGVEIGSDLWTPVPPSTFLALNGAEVILNLSASTEIAAKRERRQSLIVHQSGALKAVYAYVSAGSQESTSEAVFCGYSAIAENGKILKENAALISRDYMIVSDVDLERVRSDRLRDKTFEETLDLCGGWVDTETVTLPAHESESDGTMRSLSKLPFIPLNREERVQRSLNLFEIQVAALQKRVETVGGKIVIGVSGGLDSTLALLVATETMHRLGRPLTDVHGITLPCFGTSERTHGNATALMDALGITSKEISIKDAATLHCRDIGHPLDQFDTTFENIQARERTQVLMDYASQIGGFVLGTGDLSELALGWCTYNGDHMSMYGVNGSIPKTLIRWMIESIADYDVFQEASDILRDIVDTPISPELLPPDEDGEIAQETESIIGPYALHDFFLFYMIRYGFAPAKIFYLASLAFKDDFDRPTILHWMKEFYRRFFTSQFKRSCQPDGVTVGSVALSARGDFKMPSDASGKIWLEQIDDLDINFD